MRRVNTAVSCNFSVSTKQSKHGDQSSTNQLCGCCFYFIHPLLHLWQTSLIDHDIPTEYKLGLRISPNTVLLAANTNQWPLARRRENYLT